MRDSLQMWGRKVAACAGWLCLAAAARVRRSGGRYAQGTIWDQVDARGLAGACSATSVGRVGSGRLRPSILGRALQPIARGVSSPRMTFDLAYSMITGSGVSSCILAIDALKRHHDLVLAGASGIVVSEDGVPVSLAQLEVLARFVAPRRQL